MAENQTYIDAKTSKNVSKYHQKTRYICSQSRKKLNDIQHPASPYFRRFGGFITSQRKWATLSNCGEAVFANPLDDDFSPLKLSRTIGACRCIGMSESVCRVAGENCFFLSFFFFGSEQSERAREWNKRSRAERCGASEWSERCERTNIVSNQVALSKRDCHN